jgi:hypothetical protein
MSDSGQKRSSWKSAMTSALPTTDIVLLATVGASLVGPIARQSCANTSTVNPGFTPLRVMASYKGKIKIGMQSIDDRVLTLTLFGFQQPFEDEDVDFRFVKLDSQATQAVASKLTMAAHAFGGGRD